MGEINRSIEKMSLTTTTPTIKDETASATTTTTTKTERRGSDWTVSTEGYGSMMSITSDQMSSRRESELSMVSK